MEHDPRFASARRRSALFVSGAVLAASILVVGEPISADSTRKTMRSERDTMSSSRSPMNSTRKTGTTSVKRGAGSSTASTTGTTSATRRDGDLSSSADETSPATSDGLASEDGYGTSDGADSPGDRASVEGDWIEEYRADRLDRVEQKNRDGHRNRTLGKACIVGADGRILYRPPGAICAADVTARGTGAARAVNPAAPAPRARPSAQRSCRGRCIYGGGGRVVYAPPGCGC